jgi:uncharacterized cofD-like protein
LSEQAQPSSPIVVLGGGRGLASVLQALHSAHIRLTAIVSIAREADGGGTAQQRLTGAGVGDLRRSLEALSDEEVALKRAIRRPLRVAGLGQHPLGNLALAAAADALGDYGQASIWLGEQLGIEGAVLPATIEPERRQIEVVEQDATGEIAVGSRRLIRKLRFVSDRVESPQAAVTAIADAEWVLLAPGALYRRVLSSSAVPDLAAALRSTSARVVWIANLEPDPNEAPNLTASDHVGLLRLHGVRVDVVLHDPSATLRFDPAELKKLGVASVARPLRSAANPGVHDPEQLRAGLTELLDAHPAGTRR